MNPSDREEQIPDAKRPKNSDEFSSSSSLF
jgi:hypothetical protein